MAWRVQALHLLFGAALSAFFVATAVAAPSGGDAAFTMAAEKAVTTVEREDGFSGVILVARGDKVLLRKAAGFADRERNIPNTPDTKFPLASVTKQFTSAGIMLLVQDGKLALTDPISKYKASPPAWKAVTIQHLLTHSSGMGDKNPAHPALLFAPGTAYEYSNTGYFLLTDAIEKASGQSFGEFLRSRIFAKLGMDNTSNTAGPSDIVRGYSRSPDGQWQGGQPLDPGPGDGAGGVYSTLDDMLAWSRSLDTNIILSASTRAAMFTDYGHGYGFGWRLSPKYGRGLIWHTGLMPGFAAVLDRFPEEQLTVVAMTNNTGLIEYRATLMIEGKETTFQANAARKLVEQVERLYFGRAP
jgi:D-alanyl-D-alanine carboxypeptidase